MMSLNRTYDFFNFNTVGQNGTVNVTVLVSPTLNYDPDAPISVAIQMDSQAPQTIAFIPLASPGTEPAAWGGMDGFAANNIVPIHTNWNAPPGEHTLTVSVEQRTEKVTWYCQTEFVSFSSRFGWCHQQCQCKR
jgi:hypothetical protein